MGFPVAMYNAKGGTGKTTCAVNLAGALNELGRNCLLVDLDPQGNATEALGFESIYDDSSPTLADVLTGDVAAERVHDLVVDHEEMDLLPSNIDMLQCERALTIQDARGEQPVDRFRELVRMLGNHYDVVVLDTPPFFGTLSDASLLAAGNLIIPSLAESTSQRAVELLLDQVARLGMEHDASVNEVAAVANRIEHNKDAQRMEEWFHTVFPDIPVISIRKRVAFQRSYSAGQSLFKYDRSCDMCTPFYTLAEIVDQQRKEPTHG